MLEKIREGVSLSLVALVAVFSFFWNGLSTLTSTADVYPDVFFYNQSSGLKSVKFGDGQGNFLSRNSSWSPGWEVKAAKLNNDEFSDFFLYNKVNGQWFKSIYDGSGDFTYTNGTWSPDWETYILDLNGDSLSDVFVYNKSNGYWFKCLNISSQDGFSCGQRGQWSPGWQIYPVRLNSDLLDDLFLYNPSSGVWFRAVNETGDNFNLISGNWSPSWQIYPGDLTGDQLTDFLLYSPTLSPRAILVRNTGVSFDYPFSENWDSDWTSIKLGDFNADGKADVFLYKYPTGVWVQAITNSSGTNFSYYSGTWSPNWEVSLSDFNNDSKSDILVYNPTSQLAVSLLTTTVGQFDQKTLYRWGVNQKITANRSDLTKPAGYSPLQLGTAPFNPSVTKFGIFYSLWHCPYSENNPAGNQVYNITEAIAGRQPWGSIPTFHWSSKPPLGYYCLSRDTNVLREHAIQLRDAGIDLVFIDSTNHAYTESPSDRPREMIMDPFTKMLEIWSTIPNAPKIVPWVPGASGTNAMVNFFVSSLNQYPSMRFLYENKPLIFIFPSVPEWSTVAEQLRSTFTVRIMLGMLQGDLGSSWSFLQPCEQGFRESQGNQTCNQLVTYLNGQVEQVSVGAAYQETYMSDKRTAVPKFQGQTFVKQFEQLFNFTSVPMVAITGWNEWIAQRGCFDAQGQGALPPNCVTDQFPDGSKIFVDIYDQDYNRDIEPSMFYGDYYYRLMKQCISMYKQGQKCNVSDVPR